MKRRHIFIIVMCLLLVGCSEDQSFQEDGRPEITEAVSTGDADNSEEKVKEDAIPTNAVIADTLEKAEKISENEEMVEILEEKGLTKTQFLKAVADELKISDDELIENVRWLNEEQSVLQIMIGEKQSGQVKHERDVIYYSFENQISSFDIDYNVDGHRQPDENANYYAYLEDVTFDGQDDILISLGGDLKDESSADKYARSCLYECKEGKYEYNDKFEVLGEYSVKDFYKSICCEQDGINITYMYVDGEYVEAYNSSKIEEKIYEAFNSPIEDICERYGVSVDTNGTETVLYGADFFYGISFNDYYILVTYFPDKPEDSFPCYVAFKDEELVHDYLGLEWNMDFDSIDQVMQSNGYSLSSDYTNEHIVARFYEKNGLTCLLTADDMQGTWLSVYFRM